MLQNAPLKETGIMPPQGLLARAPRRQGMSVAPISDKALQMQLAGQHPGAMALQNAPLAQAQDSIPMQQQAGGQPWDERIPGEQDPMGGHDKKGPGLGNIISEFILNYGAASDNPLARSVLAERAAMEAQQRLFERQDSQRQEDRRWDMEDTQRKANAPQYFMSGKDRVQYDPATGQANVLYDGPEQFEDYAKALGFEPGTPDYVKAVQDAMLKSSGPTAYGYDKELDDYRTANDIQRKGSPTFLQANPRPAAPRRGSAPRTSKPRSSSKRPTATGPGGKRIEWNGSAWVPVN